MLEIGEMTCDDNGARHAEVEATAVDRQALIAEVDGAEAEQFLATLRRSLGGRTPAEALSNGDLQVVCEAVAIDLLRSWA